MEPDINKKLGIFPEPATIRFERLLPGPIERIWDYLTKSELKAKWLSAGDVEPSVGGKVEFKFKHSDLSESNGLPQYYSNLKFIIKTGVVSICLECLLVYTQLGQSINNITSLI